MYILTITLCGVTMLDNPFFELLGEFEDSI